MPSVSEKQRRAMRAAAAGKSTIGIPQSVGKEYVAADKKKREPTLRESLERAWDSVTGKKRKPKSSTGAVRG